ncbi:hypothetical protein [Parageobacillus toebii]|uniref:hypothetical protein n=1 Tax=Parageobacillus toebii TaxID=153151 RepID=UPI0028162F77|nr:hypothetical protein [Parageobacillus toebii]WMT18733.1 hypothetical protein RFB12_16055 [Parageobacillus toebii]
MVERETTDMNQLLEIINAKGDEGELEQIVHLVCNDELFWKSLHSLAEDSAKADEEGRENW